VKTWDAVVIGAGPAGAVAARVLARRGLSVLLVDKAHFPRPKACGGCLNRAALAGLAAVGLGHVPAACGATPIRRARIASGPGRAADVPLPGGVAVSREAFDAALVEEAMAAGVTVRTGVRAVIDPVDCAGRVVRLDSNDVVLARVVIDATGLAGNAGPAAAGSRVGIGTVLSADDAPEWYESGTIYLAVARFGYVGAVRVEDGRLDVAAAFDPAILRSRGPGPAVNDVLDGAGLPALDDPDRFTWKGTPLLTRRPVSRARERLFAIGDAAGYVEPFTGEGIAWAVASAAAVAPLVERAVAAWNDRLIGEWNRTHDRLIRKKQRTCRVVARVLRHPRLTRMTVGLLQVLPRLSRPVVAALNRSPGVSPT
jgi:flavin-dependent dehydrogenase